MKKNYLLPHCFKWIGWCLFLPFALNFFLGECGKPLFDIDDYFIHFRTLAISYKNLSVPHGRFTATFEDEGMFDEISLIFILLGLLSVAFARERNEDEYVEYLRTHAFVWAVKVNTVLLILGTWFFFYTLYVSFVFFWMFSLFLVYILKFQWELHYFKKEASDEE